MSEDSTLPKRSPSTEMAAGTAVFAALEDVKIPPIMKRGLYHAFNRLLGSLVDIPAAHLESVTQKIKTDANAKSLFEMAVAQAAAEKYISNPTLVDQAVMHYGARLIREQQNRESVVRQTVEDIKLNPPEQEVTQTVDDDWLEAFARVAETKTNADLQLILSRILSGELRQPGSYRQRTLHVLATLDQEAGKLFQKLCNISFQPVLSHQLACVIVEPFGRPGDNDLRSLGLDYTAFTQLQEAGLVQYELNTWREYAPLQFIIPFNLGKDTFVLKPGADHKPNSQRVNTVFFTAVGLELRRVITLDSSPNYNQKFIEWAKKKFDLEV